MIKVSSGCLGQEELNEVASVFEHGYFGHSEKVVEFEERVGEFLGALNVVATSTGTSALHLALDALGIGPGDEVIVPSLTFVASFQAILATGATPVSCEVSPDTLSIDLEDARCRITQKTKAIMPVHYAGNPCHLDLLFEIKNRYGIHIIEDAAHAFGSIYKGRLVGSFGEVSCFSFDSIKNITCGEGGVVVCSDGGLADMIRQKRLLGIDRRNGNCLGQRWKYEVKTAGYRYHMSAIHAAIGLTQLKKIPLFLNRRREICQRYEEAFEGLSVVQRLKIDYRTIAPHIYVIRVQKGLRDAFMEHMGSKGIETSIHYPPNHLQPLFKEKGRPLLPITERMFGEIVTLPLHCRLSDEDVRYVIECASEFFKREGCL